MPMLFDQVYLPYKSNLAVNKNAQIILFSPENYQKMSIVLYNRVAAINPYRTEKNVTSFLPSLINDASRQLRQENSTFLWRALFRLTLKDFEGQCPMPLHMYALVLLIMVQWYHHTVTQTLGIQPVQVFPYFHDTSLATPFRCSNLFSVTSCKPKFRICLEVIGRYLIQVSDYYSSQTLCYDNCHLVGWSELQDDLWPALKLGLYILANKCLLSLVVFPEKKKIRLRTFKNGNTVKTIFGMISPPNIRPAITVYY